MRTAVGAAVPDPGLGDGGATPADPADAAAAAAHVAVAVGEAGCHTLGRGSLYTRVWKKRGPWRKGFAQRGGSRRRWGSDLGGSTHTKTVVPSTEPQPCLLLEDSQHSCLADGSSVNKFTVSDCSRGKHT